jgi:enoyl-CoA hydratase
MSERRFISYEELDDASIVRIMLNRPERRNAQNRGLLVELGEAMLQAEADDRVRAVILGGVGPAFSSGHDLGSPESREEMTPGPGPHVSRTVPGGAGATCARSPLPRCRGRSSRPG